MNRRAVEYDIYSEPNRRAAVQKAVAIGTAAMTARIILVQEDADAEISPQFGVLLVQPTFDLSQDISTPAARAGAINVLLVAAFRMDDLMDSVLARQSIVQDNGLDVRLFDAQTAIPNGYYLQAIRSWMGLGNLPLRYRCMAVIGRFRSQVRVCNRGP